MQTIVLLAANILQQSRTVIIRMIHEFKGFYVPWSKFLNSSTFPSSHPFSFAYIPVWFTQTFLPHFLSKCSKGSDEHYKLLWAVQPSTMRHSEAERKHLKASQRESWYKFLRKRWKSFAPNFYDGSFAGMAGATV